MSARLADTIASEIASADKDGLLRPRKRLPFWFWPLVAALIASVAAFGLAKVLSCIVILFMAFGLYLIGEAADDARRDGESHPRLDQAPPHGA
jgi:hypothetical protein